MSEIRVIPLGKFHYISSNLIGAGQDVGRSCILVSIEGKNVMLDCGMHMGYNDEVMWHNGIYIAFSVDFQTSRLLFKIKT